MPLAGRQMRDSGCQRVLQAISKGRKTVSDIAVMAHLSKADTRTYLTRLKRRGLIEKEPAKYSLKETA